MHCTEVKSECIRSECTAFVSEPDLLECSICHQQFVRGSSCNEFEHKRKPFTKVERAHCNIFKHIRLDRNIIKKDFK